MPRSTTVRMGTSRLLPPGFFVRLDASDASTITATSGAVSQWDDTSGNALHVTQATGSLQPTFGTRTQNGLSVLDFAGDLLVSPTFTRAQPFTLFIAFALDVADTNFRQVFGANGNNDAISFGISNAPAWRAQAGSGQLNGGTPNTSAHVASVVYNGASSAMYIDGTSVATGDLGTVGWSTKSFAIGGRADNVQHMDGWVGEVVGYPSALSTTDRENVEAYLRSKWGTP